MLKQFLALVLILLMSGCSKITLLRTREIREVGNDVKELQKEVQALSKSVDDLTLTQGGATSKMKADLTSMLTDLQGQLSRLHSELDETQHRLQQLYAKTSRIEQKKIVVTGVSPGIDQAKSDSMNDSAAAHLPPELQHPQVRVMEGLDIDNLYTQAREDYINAKYQLAYDGFKKVYEQDPDGSFKDNALYWMGESLLKMDKVDQAITMYQRAIQEFPRGNKACSSRFKLGLIYNQRQDMQKRNESWEKLIDACAGTNEAKRAEELMKN